MLVLDVEASGTEYDLHSIVAIGALDFNFPERRFYQACRVWQGAKVMSEAIKVCGVSEDQLYDKKLPTEGETVRMLLEWSEHLVNRTIAGQNPSFDRDFLRAASGREGIVFPLASRTIDTHSLCWMHMIKRGIQPPLDDQNKRSALDLDGILRYCGIDDEPKPHNAMTGALCHAEVLSRLLYNKPLLPEFADNALPW